MKSKFVPAALFVLGIFGAGSVFAASNTLTVSASITGTCQFNSGTSTLNFGSLDQVTGGNVTANTSVTYWCTKGTTASVAAGQGSNYSGGSNRMSNGTDTIPYSLSLSGAGQTGAGKNSPLTLGIQGAIQGSDYINVSAGSYADSVTLTVTP